MRYLGIIPSLLFISIVTGLGLRGVPPHLLARYQPLKDNSFQCIHSLERIPFSRVNDYYCDCLDGSDEPGTNACPAQLFYCKNQGFYPKNISSMLVDDGVCDCCDGSDEGHLIQCPNTCASLQANLDYASKEQDKVRMNGVKAKVQMVRQGKAAITEAERQRKLLSGSIEQREALIKSIENIWGSDAKNQVPSSQVVHDWEGKARFLERAIIRTLKSRKDHRGESSSRTSHNNDQNPEAQEDDIEDHDTSAAALHELKHNWREYRKRPWTKQVDYDAASASESWCSYLLAKILDTQYSCYTFIISWVPLTSYVLPSRHWIHSNLYSWGMLAAPTGSMKSDLEQIKEKLDQDKQTLKVSAERLSRDYGPYCEFYPLDQACFSITHDGYEYEICMYGEAHQKSLDGGSSVLLGKWSGFANRTMARFTDGLRCYSGETRHLDVSFVCGENNRLVQISEPSRCSYNAVFSTPAVCQERPEDLQFYQQDTEMSNLFQWMMSIGDNCDCQIQGSTNEAPAPVMTEHVEL